MATVINHRPRLRVLFVDDNADTCEACIALLSIFGHEAHATGTGADALALNRSGGWDLALIDLHLPDMDGCEVARSFRNRHGSDITLVAASGYQGQSVLTTAMEAGFDHVFVKPLAFEVFEALVNQVARRQRVFEEVR